MPRTKAKTKPIKPPNPTRHHKVEISVDIPLYSKTRDGRYVEMLDRLGIIEQALDIAGATYNIADYASNENY